MAVKEREMFSRRIRKLAELGVISPNNAEKYIEAEGRLSIVESMTARSFLEPILTLMGYFEREKLDDVATFFHTVVEMRIAVLKLPESEARNVTREMNRLAHHDMVTEFKRYMHNIGRKDMVM